MLLQKTYTKNIFSKQTKRLLLQYDNLKLQLNLFLDWMSDLFYCIDEFIL